MKNSKYIVRQPIKDGNSRIIGHEILYYGENQAFDSDTTANDFAAADTIYNFLTESSGKVLHGSLNFMTFTTTLLVKKTPRLFDKSDLVIQIDDSVIIHPLAMHMVQSYAKDGYRVAVNEFQFAPRYLALLDSIDYIKLNFQTTNETSIKNILEIARSMDKKCIAVGVDNKELYDRALEMGVDALQGTYVAEKMASKSHSSAYLQSNFFRLMVAVTKDEPNVDEIQHLISMDASLTYGLLKMANSVYFAMRHRATTIQQAVMTLGLGQLKRWIYLLSASSAEGQTDPASEEFLKLSFMRASFCSELIDHSQGMPISKSEAYLMGMFSTLNYLIDAPLEEILSEVPIADEVREALLHHTGRCGMLYDLALSYERADWPQITELAEQLGIPSHLLTNIYFNCVEDVNLTWNQLLHPTPNQIGGEDSANSSSMQ